jgi:hypothetical protein
MVESKFHFKHVAVKVLVKLGHVGHRKWAGMRPVCFGMAWFKFVIKQICEGGMKSSEHLQQASDMGLYLKK